MGTVTVGHENSTPIELYYEDQGSGRPVVLSTAGRSTAGPGSHSCTRCSPPGTA